MENDTTENLRPTTVRVAVIVLLISVGLGIATVVKAAHWNNPLTYVVFLVLLDLELLVILLIFRGKNWARWLFIIAIVIATMPKLLNFHLPHAHAQRTLIMFSIQTVLHFIAIIALVLRPSNDYFRIKPNNKTLI